MEAVAARVGVGKQIAHILGNVMLGMALGLLAYYFATDVSSSVEQQALLADFPAAHEPLPAPEVPVFDFDWWEDEDLAYWESLGEGELFGRLTSAEMGVDVAVVKGTSRSALRKGPGWITYSDLPGPSGNTGIAGHRTTYGAPFRDIDKLKAGDTIVFYSPFRVYTYEVRKVFSVTPDRVDVVGTTKEPILTLSACHPPYSARLRLIAQSELVSVQRLDQ